MRLHHFILILVSIATYLMVFESALNLPRAKPQTGVTYEALMVTPWSAGS